MSTFLLQMMDCCAIAELTDTSYDTFARASLSSLLRIDAENTVLGGVADAEVTAPCGQPEAGFG
jgi:hypothetical protein